MKKFIVLMAVTALLISGIGIFSQAEAQTATIGSQAVAEQLAADAGGAFVQGATAPALTGTQVALPVLEGNQVVGYVVAEKASLVSALNAAGLTEVAAAVSATAAGSVAGATAATGLALGTAATAAVVGAAVIGTALVISADDDDAVTTSHATTSHH